MLLPLVLLELPGMFLAAIIFRAERLAHCGMKNLINTEREDLENVQHTLASAQGSLKELPYKYRKAVAEKRGDELNHELAELNTQLNLIHADIERVEASLRETRDTIIRQETTFQMELDHRRSE